MDYTTANIKRGAGGGVCFPVEVKAKVRIRFGSLYPLEGGNLQPTL